MWTTEWIPREYTQISKQHEKNQYKYKKENQKRVTNSEGKPY